MPTPPRVQQLLEDIALANPAHHDLVQKLRALILQLPGPVHEEVKYGGILFSTAKPFCGVFVYTHHVTLEMGEGAQLADTFKVLEGAGKQRRHIKLVAPDDIAAKHVPHYLDLAVARSRSSA